MLLAVSLAALAIPYFLFFIFWLRPLYAWLFSAALLISLALCFADLGRFAPRLPKFRTHVSSYGFLLTTLVVWVLLSGSGGYGYQSFDYHIHNGRLKDLIDYHWPVIYEGDRPLVYYFAYYLAPAVVGKYFGYMAALRLTFFWTLVLVVLIALWIVALIRRLNTWILIAFVFFSGLDALGVAAWGFGTDPIDHAEWWVVDKLYIAYPSITYQLFWSPQQVLAGWLITAMLLFAAKNSSTKSIVFLGSLCHFWSPFISMALTPILACVFLSRGLGNRKEILTFQNLFGAIGLTTLFMLYYLGGSVTTNPVNWIWDVVDLGQGGMLGRFAAFYILEFLILFLLALPGMRTMDRPTRNIVWTMVAVLTVLPVVRYGEYNDFLARGVAPYIFILYYLVMSFLVTKTEPARMLRIRKAVTVIALVVGAVTPLHSLYLAVRQFGLYRAPISAPNYYWGHEVLGTKESFFFKYLAADGH